MADRVEQYRFQNLMGAMYSKGNLEFSPDGFTLISPVGNRISLFGLKEKTAKTLPVEATTSFTSISLSPNGYLLVTGNESGEVHIISLRSETVIHVLRPGGNIKQVKFSPCGTKFAVAKEDTVLIYSAPSKKPSVNPIGLRRAISDVKNVVDVAWSHDGKIVAVSSGRGIVHLYPVVKFRNFKPITLTANTEGVVKTFFKDDKTYDILSVDVNGVLRVWTTVEKSKFDEVSAADENKQTFLSSKSDNTEWIRYDMKEKHYYNDLFPKGEKRPPLTIAAYNSHVGLLIVGFQETIFLHELQDFTLIQSMKIPAIGISTVCLNKSCDWIAFGSASAGQLVVWEWQSETMILNQTAHYDIIESFDFSNTSRVIATGGVDGKIKVWNTVSALNFAIFGDHTGPITGLAFTQKGKAIVSSSRDGTVRAFDLARYRNFRTFVTPRLVQLNGVAVDHAGELVTSAGEETFEIFMWSMKTGMLLEVYTGHTASITGLQFSPVTSSSRFVSCSLDKTLRIWPPVGTEGRVEELDLSSEATTLAISPVGDLVAVVSLSGVISLFDMDGKSQGTIDGYLYVPDKTIVTEGTSHNLKNKLRGKGYKAVAFSPDGLFVLAGGDNKVICMFHTKSQRLVTSYSISKNHSLDGIRPFIHRKKLTEFGNMDLVEDRDDAGDTLPLPGVRKGDMASRKFQNEIRVTALRFAPNGKSWAAATTEGLLIYGTQNFVMFDPIDADVTVTPQAVKDAINSADFSKALMMSLQLNIHDIIKSVIETAPFEIVELLVKELPIKYARLLLRFLTDRLNSEPELGLYMKWVEYTMVHHIWALQNNDEAKPIFKDLSQRMNEVKNKTLSLLTYNLGVCSLIVSRGTRKTVKKEEETQDDGTPEIKSDDSDASMSDESV